MTMHLIYFLGGLLLGIGMVLGAHALIRTLAMRRLGIRGQASTARGPLSVLSPRDIISELQQVPVLQQPRADKSYRGMSVHWQVSFQSAFVSGLTTLYLMCEDNGNYPWINCTVRRWTYPELSTLQKGATFYITGTISLVATDQIFLRHVRLSFDSPQ